MSRDQKVRLTIVACFVLAILVACWGASAQVLPPQGNVHPVDFFSIMTGVPPAGPPYASHINWNKAQIGVQNDYFYASYYPPVGPTTPNLITTYTYATMNPQGIPDALTMMSAGNLPPFTQGWGQYAITQTHVTASPPFVGRTLLRSSITLPNEPSWVGVQFHWFILGWFNGQYANPTPVPPFNLPLPPAVVPTGDPDFSGGPGVATTIGT